jgi:hypothetical protein
MKLTKETKLFVLIAFISFTLSTQTATEAKIGVNGGINIAEGFMKKGRKVKAALTPEEQLSKTLGTEKIDKNGKPIKRTEDLGEGPIFDTLWIKYFKYQDTGEPVKHFFLNHDYRQQLIQFPDVKKEDIENKKSKDGDIELNEYIKGETSFYAILFQENLNILTSRQAQIQKTFDVLHLSEVNTVNEDPKDLLNTKDGISDFGSFSEGFCIKVKTNSDKKDEKDKSSQINKIPQHWIFCTETQEAKEKLFKTMRKLKIEMQHKQGIWTLGTHLKADDSKDGLKDEKSKSDSGSTDPKDGYWIMLQDWTSCSLKCGGGVKTYQRMCVPPKEGGAPCEGEAIITQPCNIEPCPEILTNEDAPKKNETTLAPIVKVMPFSTRPQRYSKCVVKEADLLLLTNPNKNGNNANIQINDSSIKELQIPVRVIMNNRTFVILGGEAYDTQIDTFDLETSEIAPLQSQAECFRVVGETRKIAKLCPIGTKETRIKEEWLYDFSLFKNECSKKRDTVEMEMKMNDKLKKKIKEAKQELLVERERDIEENAEKEEEQSFEKIERNKNSIAVQAIERELDLESMIKKEEEEKETQEENEIIQKIEEEKKKNDCLLKAITEKAKANQYSQKMENKLKDIQDIDSTAKQQVQIRIENLKQTIFKKRQQAQQNKKKLMQQLQSVRYAMADTLNKAYKRGDKEKCIKAKSLEGMDAYCVGNYGSDPGTFAECRETHTTGNYVGFCNMCCDNEFGHLLPDLRKSCKTEVCTDFMVDPEKPTKPEVDGLFEFKPTIQSKTKVVGSQKQPDVKSGSELTIAKPQSDENKNGFFY